MSRIGRNQPCPCGSGQKYKRCHGRLNAPPALPRHLFDRLNADQQIRQKQQGSGRPIVATKAFDGQAVAVGGKLYFSAKWKTFIDFLFHYITDILDVEWCKAEMSMPIAARHPLMQWWEYVLQHQRESTKAPEEVATFTINGVVACYLGTAYALYLLDHNADVQARLIKRLKDPQQFQGAYYELIVASVLVRAGFKLTLEDETDRNTKHCEFAAVSPQGVRYWVEAKTRGVNGYLGRSADDGGTDRKPTSSLIRHLNGALAKPAAENNRLVFIDLNAPHRATSNGEPDWLGWVTRRIERYEKFELPEGTRAYLFVTNFAFHRDLPGPPVHAAATFGLGMADFNQTGMIRIRDAYFAKKKHVDAHRIIDSLRDYLRVPSTFDGTLVSQTFSTEDESSRVVIGQKYFFEGLEVTGTVTAATADVQAKEAYIFVLDERGKSHILKASMSDTEVDDYREFGSAYFGREEIGPREPKDILEMFEWFMRVYKSTPREKLLEFLSSHRAQITLDEMSDEELRIELCEGYAASLNARTSAAAQAPHP